MDRNAQDIPPEVSIEVIKQIEAMDREMYLDSLKKAGVSVKTLDNLRAMDGLAKDAGRQLSMSLEMTHKNFILQLMKLAEVSDSLRSRLEGKEMEDGTKVALEPIEYAAISRVYIECVKEARSGYGMMLTGTEAMVRMMTAAKGKGDSPEGKATAGWGPMKKVRDVK